MSGSLCMGYLFIFDSWPDRELSVVTACAHCTHVSCIGTERRNGGNEISGSSCHIRIG